MLNTRLGFWSFDPDSGEVTCDAVAANLCGIAGPRTGPIACLFSKIDPADRRRILRAGLRSSRTSSVFDVVARIQTPRGPLRFRLIGGRGYRLGCSEPELHGIVEQLPPG